MKRVFSIMLICILLLTSLPAAVMAEDVGMGSNGGGSENLEAAVNESEPNDSQATAVRIYHNDEVAGKLGGAFSSDNMDYFKFVLKSATKVRITTMSSDNALGFRLDDSDGWVGRSESNGTYQGMYVQELEMNLSAGTYYISVVSSNMSASGYALGLYATTATKDEGSQQPTNPPSRPSGESMSDPIRVDLNTTYTYTWESGHYSQDVYGRFTTKEDGYVTLYFNTADYRRAEYFIYDENGQEIWSREMGHATDVNVGLAAGTYYFVVDVEFYMGYNSHTGNFIVKFTAADNYEYTPNDEKETARQIVVGETYYGFDHGSAYEDDYWRIDVEEDCRILITTSESNMLSEFIDSKGEVTNRFPYSSKIPVDLTAGVNYIVIDVQYTSTISDEYWFKTELHECEFEIELLYDYDCEEAYETTQTCWYCGYEEDVFLEPGEHEWSDWKVLWQPSPTQGILGKRERRCEVCRKYEDDYFEAQTNPFTDVPDGKYYTEPILWALEKGITTGKTATTFEPGEPCTRGQIVTFLWRAMGEPEPDSYVNPFTDVKESAYYYKAVLWAYYEGITTGKTDTTFEPKAPCTRCQVVTFLWRTMGKPSHSQSNPFSDIPGGKYYTNAVLWALENGITTGKTATTFLPDETCTRAQIVTFLYRTLVEN